MELFLSRLDKRRDILLYKMLYLTGARIQEVLDLEIDSVPIFDNGGCFTDKADDFKLSKLLDEKLVTESSLNFRTSYGREVIENEPESLKQMNAKEFIDFVIKFNGFVEAIKRNIPLIEENFNEIKKMISIIPNTYNNIQICSDIQKTYFIKTMEIRYNKLLLPTYNKFIAPVVSKKKSR